MNRKKLMFGSGKSGPLIAGTVFNNNDGSGAYFAYVSGGYIPADSSGKFEYNGDLLTTSINGDTPYENCFTNSNVQDSAQTITDWNIDMSAVSTMKGFAQNSQIEEINFENVSGTAVRNWNYAFNNSKIKHIDLSMFQSSLPAYTYQMFANCPNVVSIILPGTQEFWTYYYDQEKLIANCPNLEYVKFTGGRFMDEYINKENEAAQSSSCMFSGCPKLTTIDVTHMTTNNNADDILLWANYLYPDFVLDYGDYIPSLGVQYKCIRRHSMLNILGTNSKTQDGGSINCSFMFNGEEITSIPQKSDGNKFVCKHFIYDAYEQYAWWHDPLYLINNNLNTQDAPFGITTLYEAFANNSDILTVTSSMPLTYLDNCVRTFYNCSNLAQVHFIEPLAYSPGYARNDNEYAQISCYQMFENCNILYKVTMFNMYHVTNMQEMFYGCSDVESIILPNTNNVRIWDSAFYGCSKLKTIAFVNDKTYDSVTENALHAFDSVTSFTGVFTGCSSLTEIVLNLPETESPLQLDRTFANCSNVTKITLNQDPYNEGRDLNLDSTSFSVFQGCSSLRQVIVYGTNAHTIVKNWLNSNLGGTWVEQGDGFYKN